MVERGVPEGIIEQFRKNLADGKPELNNKVWLDCHGENPGDRENLGPVHYHPGQGFSANYYPYENQVCIQPIRYRPVAYMPICQ
jgi:sodium/potassium-transporting ATPase subunit beta